MKKLPTISKEIYELLTETKGYVNHICNTPSKIGGTKTFQVKDSELTITLKCSQIGGMWSGEYCYVPINT